jgi:hypothetical protein
MITIAEAFEKFKSRLEPGSREEAAAVSRRERVKAILDNAFHVDRVFLTGSYKRWTKIRPLKDVDLFCVLNTEKEGEYLKKSSRVLLDAFASELRKEYGNDKVDVWDKCVTVCFGEPEDEEEEGLFSIDVVPAFDESTVFRIPDAYHPSGWMKSDPEIHAELATKANQSLGGKWVTLVKMAKKCNAFHGKPVNPSFLLEVMALKLIVPPFSGGYKYEIKSFFASVLQQIGDKWPDPAGLGSDVSEQMTPAKVNTAKVTLIKICTAIDKAGRLEREGKIGDALATWRNEVFGPMFPLS